MSISLAQFPYVVVRIGCDLCGRKGQYRLSRLAAKYGAEIQLDELSKRLAADCAGLKDRHPYRVICQATVRGHGLAAPLKLLLCATHCV